MTTSVILPPSPSGPGMIKSPPLDVANLIAILKQNTSEKIALSDLRFHIINNDSFWEKKGVDLSLFNEFKRCINHFSKEDKEITNNVKKILYEINLKNSDYLIFSVAILEQFSLQYLISSLCLANQIKKDDPSIKIIFFGNCPKEHSKRIIGLFDFIDAFLNDGNEFSIIDYLKHHSEKSPIKGIYYRENNKVIFTDEKREMDLNAFPLPDFSMFDLERYKSNGKLVLPYELSRGCINNCFFCYYIHKNKMAIKDISKVISDLKVLSKTYNTDYFHFMDAEINFDNKYLQELCTAFTKELPNIKWSALAIPNIDYETLKKLKEAGCIQLRWGVEYGSERMLEIINKKTTVKNIKETLKNAHKLGIYNYITLLSSLKNEKEEDIKDTIEFIKEIKPYIDSAKECVYGELGHFSLLQLEMLFKNKKKEFNLAKKRYREVLNKYRIPSEDIIDVLTRKKAIHFIITPNDFFPEKIKEGEGDDKIPHKEVFTTISYLKSKIPCTIKYSNFSLLFEKRKNIFGYLKKNYSKNQKEDIKRIIKLILKFIKKSDYFVYYIPLWNENLKTSLLLAKIIKQIYPSSKNIFLGPCCNLYAGEVLKGHPFIDFVITSEPEEPIEEIISGKKIEEINDIAYSKEDKIYFNEEKGFDIANSEHYLDYSVYFEFLKKYSLPKPPFLYYELSRGCIYNCFFCSLLTARKLRSKKIEFGIKELKKIVDHTGVRFIFFTDNELNFDNDYLNKFLDVIIESKINIRWSSYMVARDLSFELIKKMKRAGCVFIRWGIESANPEKQKIISKRLDPEEVSKILEISRKLGIKNQVSFSIGYPYDCEKDRVLTIQFIEKNHQNFDCINLNKFKPRRKSLIHEFPEKYGIRIISDGVKQDEVPFEEINGLDWYMKKEQQIYYQNDIEDKLKEFNLKNIDPEVYFKKLIKNTRWK